MKRIIITIVSLIMASVAMNAQDVVGKWKLEDGTAIVEVYKNGNVYNGKMVIEKINKPKYSNLSERLEAFYQKPIDEIYVESTQEIDVGEPKGEEVW